MKAEILKSRDRLRALRFR